MCWHKADKVIQVVGTCQPSHTPLSLPSMALAWDPRALVDEYLEANLGMTRNQRDYQLLQVRHKATQREIDMLTKKFDIYLHPDKFTFDLWVSAKYFGENAVSLECMALAKEDIKNFYQLVKDTKLRLIDIDIGHHQQAWIHKLYIIILMIRCGVQPCMCKLCVRHVKM